MLLQRPPEREVTMRKSEMFGGFSLEADDRTEEEKLRQKALKKSGVASGLGLGLGQEAPKAPMDTDYQEEMEVPKDRIRFNLNFDRWVGMNCCSLPSMHHRGCSWQSADGCAAFATLDKRS